MHEFLLRLWNGHSTPLQPPPPPTPLDVTVQFDVMHLSEVFRVIETRESEREAERETRDKRQQTRATEQHAAPFEEQIVGE